MTDTRKIKSLKTQLKRLQDELGVIKLDVANKQRDLSAKVSSIRNLEELLSNLEKVTTIRVSEHALVRYFERVKGFNIEEIEQEILSKEVLDLVDKLGGKGKYPNKDYQVVMRDYVVTTILT